MRAVLTDSTVEAADCGQARGPNWRGDGGCGQGGALNARARERKPALHRALPLGVVDVGYARRPTLAKIGGTSHIELFFQPFVPAGCDVLPSMRCRTHLPPIWVVPEAGVT